jgi:hypothetical protein
MERTVTGSPTGPRAVRPTKAVTEVETPVTALLPLGRSVT